MLKWAATSGKCDIGYKTFYLKIKNVTVSSKTWKTSDRAPKTVESDGEFCL